MIPRQGPDLSVAHIEPPALYRLRGADADCRIEQVGLERLDEIRRLNRVIFHEDRVINRFDKPDLMLLLACVDDVPVGFKVGYGESDSVFYSAKGGVLKSFRRKGIARMLLQEMERRVNPLGYTRLAYDTFPNRHPGMTILGLQSGFKVVHTDFNHVYRDFRLRMEKKLTPRVEP